MTAEQATQARRERRRRHGRWGGEVTKRLHGSTAFREAAAQRWGVVREDERRLEVQLLLKTVQLGLSFRTRKETRALFGQLFPEFEPEIRQHRTTLAHLARVFGIHRHTARRWFRVEQARQPALPVFEPQAWEREALHQLLGGAQDEDAGGDRL